MQVVLHILLLNILKHILLSLYCYYLERPAHTHYSRESSFQVEFQFSPVEYGRSYGTAIGRNGERESCEYALHKSLWLFQTDFPFSPGGTLRNLCIDDNTFNCENWKLLCLNDKIRNNVRGVLILFLLPQQMEIFSSDIYFEDF